MFQGRGGAMMKASTTAHAPSLLSTGMVAACIRLIRKRLCTVRLWVGFLVVGYVRRRAWGSNRLSSFRRDPVSYFDFLLINCLCQLVKLIFPFGLLEGVVLDLLFNKFVYADGNGRDIDYSFLDRLNFLKLSYTLVYSLLHCSKKSSFFEILGKGYIDHGLDDGNHLRVRV